MDLSPDRDAAPAPSDRPTPIVELGVAEAYELLRNRFGQSDLPPLDAIENEDWGRDALLSRFLEIPTVDLLAAGLSWDEPDRD